MSDTIPFTTGGSLNNYTIKPRNLTEYTAFRGVTDFTQIGQFAQYETGYSFLQVLQMPKFMVELGKKNSAVQEIVDSFQHMLEFEFKGLDGLQDLQSDSMEISDGINSVRLINKVSEDTSVSVSMEYYEKTGSLITKFSDIYLTGIKDPKSQAKTYHGLIQNGVLAPSPENEVFTLLYYVTDNTMCRLEKAYLLCNAQLTKAERSMYNSQRSDINNKTMNIEFQCYPVHGARVDQAAMVLLGDITGTKFTLGSTYNFNGSLQASGNSSYATVYEASGKTVNRGIAALDSGDFNYGIMNAAAPDSVKNAVLVDALAKAE